MYSKDLQSNLQKYRIGIQVQTRYLEDQSEPDEHRFAFAYHITIRNLGAISAQLLSRHWIITDANGEIEEVKGAGVVGEQPLLIPHTQYQYTSGAILKTPVGHMQGSYQMRAGDGVFFEAPIPAFTLAVPSALH